MSDRLVAAVVGCGNIGCRYDLERSPEERPYSHAGGYAAHPGFVLAAACDPDPGRRADASARWPGLRTFSGYEEMLDVVRPDVVSIATPSSMRLEAVNAAIAAGVRIVFCEKPLAVDAEEARAMVDTCRVRGVLLAVNFSRRWEPACADAARLLSQGAIGPVQRIVGTYVRGLANNGSHLIDLVRWWCGDVTGVRHVLPALPGSPDVRLEMASGVPFDLQALAGDAVDVFELTVFGRDGMLRLEDFGNRVTWRGAEPLAMMPGVSVLGPTQDLQPDPDGTMLAALDNIAQCVSGKAQLACDGRDGLAVQEILEEIARHER